MTGREAMKAVFTALALTAAFLNSAQAKVIPACRFLTITVCEWTGRIPQATVVGPIVTRTCGTDKVVPRNFCTCTVAGSVKNSQGLIVLKLFKMEGVTKCVPI
jgi:hypothetical protein